MIYSVTYPAQYQPKILQVLQDLEAQIAMGAVPEFGKRAVPPGAVIVITVQPSKLVESE
jgi:hypothetical protein